jgi:phosphate-selective porin
MNKVKNILSKLIIPVAWMATMLCLSVNAQDTADDRIAKLENTVAKLPKFSGDVNVRYRYDDLDNANSFDVRRARLDIRGSVTKQLEYRIYLDFVGAPKMTDAYLTWKMNDYLSLQAGQYKIPFSLENPYNPNALETVDNSTVISNLVNYSDKYGVSANGRDVGLMLTGNLLRRDGFSIINYSAGVFNGQGINVADKNKQKDFSGTVIVNPFKSLSLAVSHYNGWAGDDEFARHRTGFGAKYDDNRLLVRTEYIQGKNKREDTASDGAYGVVGYFVHPKIQALAKYDYFRGDTDDNNTRQENYILGVNYLPVNSIRLQFNFVHKITHDKNSNQIVAQLWVKF